MVFLSRPTAKIVLLHLPSFFVTRLGKTNGCFSPFYSLAFVHGYIGGVSLYFNDLVFSLGGQGMGGVRSLGDGFAVYQALKGKE